MAHNAFVPLFLYVYKTGFVGVKEDKKNPDKDYMSGFGYVMSGYVKIYSGNIGSPVLGSNIISLVYSRASCC